MSQGLRLIFLDVDGVIDKCLEAKGAKPGKLVQVSEGQLKALYQRALLAVIEVRIS